MRIALGVEYNGFGYHGWQAQKDRTTIAGTLQNALEQIAKTPIHLHCAGRTDAHVHATGQVVHFDTHAKRHIDAWIWGTNAHLPASIAVKWAKATDYHFHARFSAKSRRYVYIIFNNPIRPALFNKTVTWHYYPLKVEKMQEAGKYLLGENDFSSFRSSQCNSKTPMRKIFSLNIYQQGNFIYIDVKANAFLHHMVRNIVGVLLKIGSGQRPPTWMQEVLLAKSRQAAAETAPPDGLYLTEVEYPETYLFPAPEAIFLL